MIEFALIGPVFFMVMWGATEIGMAAFASALLEGAAREASRIGKTGYKPAGTTQSAHVLNAIHTYTGNFLDMSKLQFEPLAYSGFDSVGVAEPFTDSNGNGTRDPGEAYTDTNGNGSWDNDQGKAGLGTSGQVVVYTLTYDWVFFGTGYSTSIFGVPGIALRASIAVRNEPY